MRASSLGLVAFAVVVLALLALAVVATAGSGQGGFHGGCSADGGLPPTFDADLVGGAAGTLDPGASHAYVVTLGPGEHVVALGKAGAASLQACKVGSVSTSCQTQDLAVAETCGLVGLPGNPGAGVPLLGPGTFRIDVTSCFTAACGYPVEGSTAYAVTWTK